MPNLALDFSNADIPDGWFDLFIETAVVREPKDKDEFPFIALKLKVDSGVYEGFEIQSMVSLKTSNQYAAKNLKTFLEAATGITWESGQELQVEEDGTVTDVVSRNVGGNVVTKEDNQGNVRTQVRMGSWVRPENLPEPPPTGEEDEMEFDLASDSNGGL